MRPGLTLRAGQQGSREGGTGRRLRLKSGQWRARELGRPAAGYAYEYGQPGAKSTRGCLTRALLYTYYPAANIS